MKPRIILAMMGAAVLAVLSFTLQAQEKGGPSKDDIITNEQQLARQFGEFQDALLRLKQKLARGTAEEKKRAETLDKVLDLCKELAINQEFTKMIEVLRTADLTNTDKSGQVKDLSDSLAGRLSRVLNLLRDSNVDHLSKDRKDLQAIIEKLERNITQQQQVQAQTQRDKTDLKDLKAGQQDTTKETKKIEDAIKKYLDPKGAETANLKGENKDAGKNKGAPGEAKDAGNKKPSEGAKGEAKDAGKDSKGKKGEAKAGQDSKAGDPKKAGDQEPKAGAKAGEKSGADPKKAGAKGEQKGDQKGKEGAAKDNKGDPKAGKGKEGAAKGDPKAGDPKAGKPGEAKGGEPKAGDPKAGDPKGGPPSEAKAGGEKAPAGAKDVKGGDAKGGDAKGGDAKASPGGDPKAGDAKSGDSKDGQGSAKDGGSPAAGSPMAGGSPPQPGQKGDGQPPPPSSPKGGEKDDVKNAKKKINEAGYDQAKAENALDKKDTKTADKKQADAIQKMQEAKKKLENLLRQMREEEIERVLAALQARCEKMLMMQTQVWAGTKDLDILIKKNGSAPDRLNKAASLKLADQEKDIVQEANKCIDILEAEGSAVAFPEVFQQVRQDMIHVQKRLELTDTGKVTVGIEEDIIDTLKEMIDALKKARQENQSEPGKPGQPGKAGQPGDQKLLELLQELKMVRSLQKRVNDRTTRYGKSYPGEQANDRQVVRELRSLSERQLRIQEIVSRIAKGDNK